MSATPAKPVIFLAYANDQDDRVRYLRNLPEEARQIREPLQRAKRDGLCEYVELANATAADIFRVFQDAEYRDRIAIFHYGGHANGYQLLLETSDGQPVAADAGGLAAFLGQQNGLQLAFLNGCSTQQQVEGLLNANVSTVIATSRAIDDQVAMNFAKQFYQGLAGGATIQTAYHEAEASIQTAKGSNTRGLYFGDPDQPKQSQINLDRWPWELTIRDGAETVVDWSLPQAVGDPLFGLPPLPDQDLPPTPFRHLNWFDEEHADVFFGRGHQIRDLYDLVTSSKSAPIVLLYGQSGVGKSSMLAAGLIPRLMQTYDVRYVRRDHEMGLLSSLKIELRSEADVSGSSTIHFATDWLDADPDSSKPLVVIVDQLEECFTRPNPNQPQELDDFLNEFQAIFGNAANRGQGRLILGFRKEWLAEIETRLLDRKLPRAKVFLERLGRRGIIEAVLGPTKSQRLQDQYGLSVEEGLAEIIADDLLDDRDSAIAPTLQILLTKMWDKAIEQNQSHPHFDQDLYRALKRDGILLQDFLDQQFNTLRQWREDVVDSGLVLDLLSLHTTPLGTAEQRSADELPESYPHRADVLQPLLQQCKDLYLLVDPSQDRSSVAIGTRLSHDTLAPLIRARFEDSDKPGQRARRILENRKVDWQDDERGTPLDIQDLKIVEQGQPGTRALDSVEQRLLEASRSERTKRFRVQKMLKVLGGAAIIAITLLGMIAMIAWNRAASEESRKTELLYVAHMNMVHLAWENGLPGRARDLLDRHIPAAGKPDLRTVEWHYYDALSRSVEAVPTISYGDKVSAVAPDPVDDQIALAGNDLKIQIWSPSRLEKIQELVGHTQNAKLMRYSSDGKFLLSCDEGAIRVWQKKGERFENKPVFQFDTDRPFASRISSTGQYVAIPNGEQVELFDTQTSQSKTLAGHKNRITCVRFLNGGEELVTASEDGTIRRWDLRTGKSTEPIISLDAAIQAMDISDNDESIAFASGNRLSIRKLNDPSFELDLGTVSEKPKRLLSLNNGKSFAVETDNEISVWNFADGNFVGRLAVANQLANGPIISESGTHFATGGSESVVYVWNSNELNLARKIIGHKNTIYDVAFFPTGRVVTGSRDKTVKFWDSSEPMNSLRLSVGDSVDPDVGPNSLYSLSISPDSKLVAVAVQDSRVVVWNTATGVRVEEIDHHTDGVHSVKFSPNGSLLASSGADKLIRLWDLIRRESVGEFAGHTNTVNCIDFSPDGKMIISGGKDGEVIIWDVETRKEINRYTPKQEEQNERREEIWAVAFSRDGQSVVFGGMDDTIRVWRFKSASSPEIFELMSENITSLNFSPDGKTLSASSADGVVAVYDYQARDVLLQQMAHSEDAMSTSFSADGNTLVSVGLEGTRLRFWNLRTGEPTLSFHVEEHPIHSVSFSPDGKLIAVARWDGTARIWKIN